MSVFLSERSIPSTTSFPSLIGSSSLIVRMRVDFPEPEGPQTTTTSPARTRRLILFSTWRLPNHLWTPSNRIIAPPRASPGPLDNGAEEGADAVRQRHGQRSPKRDAQGADATPRAAGVRRQRPENREARERRPHDKRRQNPGGNEKHDQ